MSSISSDDSGISKEAVMAFFGVKYEGGVFDFEACSDMPSFMSAFTAACMAEADAGRAAFAATESGRFNTQAIIEEEGMGEGSVGFIKSLIITDDGDLTDGTASEAADLTSEDAFRAQVRRWKNAINA